MGFMGMFTYKGDIWEVTTDHGSSYVLPATDFSKSEALKGDYSDDGAPVSAELVRGVWYGRYSASGYMDCGPWHYAKTKGALVDELREMYGDDDE
jgi:hypothetical protein